MLIFTIEGSAPFLANSGPEALRKLGGMFLEMSDRKPGTKTQGIFTSGRLQLQCTGQTVLITKN